MNFRTQYLQEIKRLGLDESMCPYGCMATSGSEAEEEFLAHLRQLVAGVTWRDVFLDIPEHWDLNDPDSWTAPERTLGAFDYPAPPRGSAVFALMGWEGGIPAGTAALENIGTLGIPIYGAGMVLDRGAPHMYVILPLGTPNENVELLAEFLRNQPGILNAYPERFEAT